MMVYVYVVTYILERDSFIEIIPHYFLLLDWDQLTCRSEESILFTV